MEASDLVRYVHVFSCIKSRLMGVFFNNLRIIYREGNEAFVDDDYELAVKVGTVNAPEYYMMMMMCKANRNIPVYDESTK